jgi:hypothetical protein
MSKPNKNTTAKPGETAVAATAAAQQSTTTVVAGEETIESLKAALEAEKKEHENTKASASDMIALLKLKLASYEEKLEDLTAYEVEHKGKKYVANIKSFKFEGHVYNVADLKAKPELVDKLLAVGSGVLSEIK